ncbi:MAG: elongation factor 1-beta [Methanomicrobiaceae archaeon]|nr:elongation factor 1-beta [Methanomicrobiaceae archaeon]
MGNVAVILKIMPESPEIDLAALQQAIRTGVPETQDIREEPIGFGLSALKVAVVVPDREGATEGIEEMLRSMDGVASAEIISLTLT